MACMYSHHYIYLMHGWFSDAVVDTLIGDTLDKNNNQHRGLVIAEVMGSFMAGIVMTITIILLTIG